MAIQLASSASAKFGYLQESVDQLKDDVRRLSAKASSSAPQKIEYDILREEAKERIAQLASKEAERVVSALTTRKADVLKFENLSKKVSVLEGAFGIVQSSVEQLSNIVRQLHFG